MRPTIVLEPDTIPLADEFHPLADVSSSAGGSSTQTDPVARPKSFLWRFEWFAAAVILIIGVMHGVAIWIGLGGQAGLTNGWPLWRDDHPLYYHSALVTRDFLQETHTTAGYDPSFMAGYAKSVVFPASSTLPELVVAAFGGSHPEFAYKLYVLYAAAALPWLIVWACRLWRITSSGAAVAMILALLYVWTDFPINYVTFGMLPYFLGVPLGLVATGAFSRYLTGGGISRWISATFLLSLAVLVHFTTAMVVAPAAAIAYLAAAILWRERRPDPSQSADAKPRRRPPPTPRLRTFAWPTHLAVWLIPPVVLALNAFWWYPGIWLAQTKGDSSFAFAHPEGVLKRLLQVISSEAPMESVLLAIGIPGLYVLWRKQRVQACALLGFCGFGLVWGYLAGGWRNLDFLQPGRHTYALYLGLAVASGAAVEELIIRIRGGSNRFDHFECWIMAGALLFAIRIFGYPMAESVRLRLWAGEPFLSSRPSPRLQWVLDRVGRHVKKGERLLYEEGGKDLPGTPDPFHRGRFSGLLPERTGVELIGGPYLHAALKTNFTQFGEGKLFDRADWNRDFFVRHARLYRPSAILCWSPHARRFCKENPDIVQILDDDGTLLIGRVSGFEGDTIKGTAHVKPAGPRLEVHDMAPDLDGTVILRYHFVPYLRTTPQVACEPVYLEDDPVPFIQLRPTAGIASVELELLPPPSR